MGSVTSCFFLAGQNIREIFGLRVKSQDGFQDFFCVDGRETGVAG